MKTHSMKRAIGLSLIGLTALAARAAIAGDEPAPVPVNRPEVKETLEGSKRSKPRLPLPPLTDEEKARALQGRTGENRGMLGGVVNNGRMRNYYIAPELRGDGSSRRNGGRNADSKAAVRAGASDPSMPLDPTFRVMFFWLVARTNNCYYCLGHQEVKLKAAGVEDDRLAALDTDWSAFTPAERAAFSFVHKLARTPNELTAADVEKLRAHYNDMQILDIIVSTAGFTATTRWTGGLMIPQEEHRVYLTPTAEKYRSLVSLVAPVDRAKLGASTKCAPLAWRRQALEPRAEVEAKLAECRTRTPRLPLVPEEKVRELLPAGSPVSQVPEWMRLLAHFPEAGKGRIGSLLAARDKGELDHTLRAQIFWIAARQDRAWYALGHARERLRELGQSDDAIFALDAPQDGFSPAQRAVFVVARKLTADPALVTDADVEEVRKHFSDRQTAEVVYFVTLAAFFDRVTEASGLQLEF